MPEGDPSPLEIVRRQFDGHSVALGDPDVILAHLARDMTEKIVPVLKLDPELAVREGLGDDTLYLKAFGLARL
jgi:hypothetical protein